VDSQYSTNGYKTIDVGVDSGVISKDFLATATAWTLDSNESKATMLVCTNAGGNTNIITPTIEGKMYVIRNNTTKTLTIKTATSTGIAVLATKTVTVMFVGADFIKIGEV